ncbi:MAG: BLUF domain-containing protein [Pseudomonadota bacterium]
MELSFVLYRSKAHTSASPADVSDIVTTSLHLNAREGLTGFLHFDRGFFLQYLEGPPGPLARKIARIHKDRRHDEFTILADGDIDERFFPDWDMGQISKDLLPNEGPLATHSWLLPVDSIDPLPLIEAFAAHAGRLQGAAIEQVD